MDYNEIYGMNLEEYCKRHNTSISNIINKVSIDIDILSERLDSLKHDMFSKEFNLVYGVLDKKRKHLNRLKEWSVVNG